MTGTDLSRSPLSRALAALLVAAAAFACGTEGTTPMEERAALVQAQQSALVTGKRDAIVVNAQSGLCLRSDGSGALSAQACSGAADQEWYGSGAAIVHRQTGRCLTAGGVAPSTQACSGSAGQAWTGQGTTLRNAQSGLCLAGSGAAVSAQACSGGNEQNWQLPRQWPTTVVLVHGYSGSGHGAAGIVDTAALSRFDNFWYWQGKYSDNVEVYDLPATLEAAAAADGQQITVKAANWDGRSTIESQAHHVTDALDCFCTGPNTCDLVGHSTGDALIGYVLDKLQGQPRPLTSWSASQGRCVATGGTQPGWNVRTIFVAGGAGGGTEAADWQANAGKAPGVSYFMATDPVVNELIPSHMRALYNHDMHGLYAGVPNLRYAGAGMKTDQANGFPYAVLGEAILRGQSDGLVPFHSQGGVSQLVGSLVTQAYDAYCIKAYTSVYSCGQLNLGSAPALQWGYWAYSNVALFAGYRVQMIDDARLYNHSDEIGRLGAWINKYKHDQAPWLTSAGVP